jgi:hypothetical protein
MGNTKIKMFQWVNTFMKSEMPQPYQNTDSRGI